MEELQLKELIISLIKTYPNNFDLGEQVRFLLDKLKDGK